MSVVGNDNQESGAYDLVFDVGGTFVRVGAVEVASGRLFARKRALTPNFITEPNLRAEELVDRVVLTMKELGDEVGGSDSPRRVIVGYPGPVLNSGEAIRAPTILGAKLDRTHSIGSRVRATWGHSDVLVMNDLSCAGFAYVERGLDDFCVLTVGSGIGNKVFIDGRPYVGPRGRGGEIGHLRIGVTANRCPEEVGNISSGRGAVAFGRRWVHSARALNDVTCGSSTLKDDFNSAELVQAFLLGDQTATAIVRATSYPLAQAIGSIHLALGIESFFVIGGFATALGEPYRQMLVKLASEVTWDVGQQWDQMLALGSPEQDEALRGAAYVAQQASFNLRNTSAIYISSGAKE